MNILILAPHQDDEILCAAGLIQILHSRGDDIFVLFATNGDYRGLDIARKRYYESRDALALLEVDASKIFYLGFRDTGMQPSHSFLQRLLLSPMADALEAPISSKTYHPANMGTIRFFRTGTEGPLSKITFLADLAWCIDRCDPELLVLPSKADAHGDHAALAALAECACNDSLPRLSYLIHGGDDIHWPPRTLGDIPCPPVVLNGLWTQRIQVPLTESQQQWKRKAINLFSSQLSEDCTGFLHAFARKEELFFFRPKDIDQLRDGGMFFGRTTYPTK